MNRTHRVLWGLGMTALLAVGAGLPRAALAHVSPDDKTLSPDWVPGGVEDQRNGFAPRRSASPMALPDIFGPGAVLNVGNVVMKITNNGVMGNPFTTSSDPSCQWPGAAGIEYMNFLALSVGAVKTTDDPLKKRRVSYAQEWRPKTLNPEDRIYRAYDGILNGTRYGNDDGDFDLQGNPKVDEDFLDGADNDGDGKIDEDFAAIGQLMYSCAIWDNTIQAINTTFNEKHVPVDLECHQAAWAYSVPGFQDFDVLEFTIFNRSDDFLDSLYIAWRVDMDCGPAEKSSYWTDDFDVPSFPHGIFTVQVPETDGRLQRIHADIDGVDPDSALCPRMTFRVNGFSVADDDGDDGKTPGVPSFLLLNHTTDPLGENGPRSVGFRAFRSHIAGTPYNQGGNPTIDQQRFEFMSGTDNINTTSGDPDSGFINAVPGDQKGDYQAWCSVGPFRHVPIGGSVQATVAVGVQPGRYNVVSAYNVDYQSYLNGRMSGADLLEKYPGLDNALAVQVAYEGVYEQRSGFPVPDFHGRETGLKNDPGIFTTNEDCHDLTPRPITDTQYSWFDFDCNYCTGAYDAQRGVGLFHHTWLAESPPPNPGLNTSVTYNFTDNPDRRYYPSQDNEVDLAWNNLSEITPDPKTGQFDFRGYKVWKVANWTRPVGSAGPNDDEWSLLANFRLFDYADSNFTHDRSGGVDTLMCPVVFVPSYRFKDGHRDTATVKICLRRGDMWDRQNGEILRPDPGLRCDTLPNGQCKTTVGCQLADPGVPCSIRNVVNYPVGRYRYVDREVKNGFTYFYSVTAFDSTGRPPFNVELNGRRSSVEAEGVAPQVTTRTGKQVWVVPNPYRGFQRIVDRSSAWDLTPNASDPTGTHIDFFGLPRGPWTIKIFTVSGDLVEELHSTDAINESVRSAVTIPNPNFNPNLPTDPVSNPATIVVPGYNRQQDNPNDGQARWNLISRNGQDVVSGIYIFTVHSHEGVQRGKFVIIR